MTELQPFEGNRGSRSDLEKNQVKDSKETSACNVAYFPPILY